MKEKKNIVFPLIVIMLILIAIYLLISLIVAWVTPPPVDLGGNNNRLNACLSYPAYVSTQTEASDPAHVIAAIDNKLPVYDAQLLIKRIMALAGPASQIASKADSLNFEIRMAFLQADPRTIPA